MSLNGNKSVEVIILEDSSDGEDSSDEYETIKLLCHICGKKIEVLEPVFEGLLHQIEEHNDEFKINMSKDFDDYDFNEVIVDENFSSIRLYIGLYIGTAESKELLQWKKLGIYEFSDRKYFKKYLHSIASIYEKEIKLKSNFEIIPKFIKQSQITLVDIENVLKKALSKKEIVRIEDSYKCNHWSKF